MVLSNLFGPSFFDTQINYSLANALFLASILCNFMYVLFVKCNSVEKLPIKISAVSRT